MGKLAEPMSGQEFGCKITEKLQRTPLHIPSNRKLRTIAWCTGAAQDYLESIAHKEVDGYLTGEISERSVSIARELDMHFYAAGHHATERFGVKALGEHLKEKFNLDHEFIDIDNPV